MIAVLLLVFGLNPVYIFPVSADIPAVPNFNVAKIAGTWHPIAMAHKLPGLCEIEQKISQMDHIAEIVDGADIKLSTNYMSDGVCKTVVKMLKHTDKPGEFSFPGGRAYFVDVDYEKFIILYVIYENQTSMFLSVRGADVGDDIKEKFKQLALDQKIPEANITFFKNVVEQCTPKAA